MNEVAEAPRWTPRTRKYCKPFGDSIADAVADLGKPEEIGNVFADFQKFLYLGAA